MTDRTITVTVCSSCPLGQTTFSDRLRDRLEMDPHPPIVTMRECMSGCARPSTVAVRAPGKTAYLFGGLSEDDVPLIENFLRLYRESDTGDIADARVLEDLRFKAIARIPG